MNDKILKLAAAFARYVDEVDKATKEENEGAEQD